MKKLIKLEFNNTTRERKTEDSYSELYSYDKNNGSFEFEILNETLTTEQVTALFKFTESNKIWKTTGTVEGNKVNVTFDTSLITQNETVICYLYFDEEQRTSDTFRFKFKVKVSEIDKMSRYEVKERFINNTVIVDRLDVVTKDELKEVLKNVGGIATEGLLTEVKAEELYAKKTEAVDNTNFELVKNRVLALELKTDKDTVYDDSEVKERLTTLENKPPVDLSNYATKEELRNVSGSQPNVDNLVTKEELENKHYISDVSNLATKDELNEIRNSQPTVDTSNLVTRDELTAKNYLTEHQSLDNLVTKQELEEKHYLTQHQDLSPYALKSEIPQPYNDTPLNERITALENKPTTGGSVDTSNFVTKEELADATPATLYEIYRTDTLKETLDENVSFINPRNVARDAGKIYLNPSSLVPKVFKGDIGNEKTVDLDVVMYSVANSLPDGYTLSDVENDINNRVLFLSNKNFSEVVPKEELKAIVKEFGGSTGSNIDTSNLATKEELANVVTKEELNNKHYVTEEELNNKAYLTTHQSLDNVVTKEELATKGYISDVSNLVTKEELESKNYLTTPYNDTPLKERVEVLENKVDKDTIYNDTELRNRVEVLENKPNVDLSSYVTNEQLENKGFIKKHQELSHLATTSDLEALRNIAVSKSELSSKVDNTEFNTFKDNVVTKTELSEKGYLTTPYNDTPLKERVEALEYKVGYDNSLGIELKNSVNSLQKRVDDLEYKLRNYDDIDSYLATKNELNDYVKRTELPAPYDDTNLRNEFNFMVNSAVDNELRNKEYEFNSRFVAKNDLRTLVTEIVNQLKSENN